jgi:RNA polymerase sigma-70 factor (ECF subfamily)
MDEPGGNGSGNGQLRPLDWIGAAVVRYQRPLIGYAARLLGNDFDAARDVVQEAFLKLCEQERAKVEPHLVEWLFAVCRNRALDVMRKEKRMRLLDDSQAHALADPSDPSTAAQSRGDATSILAMLDDLPANQAEVIRLKFQHGLSYEQISGITQLSIGNVGYLIHTGIKALRQRLRVPEQSQRRE